MFARPISCAVAALFTTLSTLAPATGFGGNEGPPPINLRRLATFDAGGTGSAEIVAFHPGSKRLFVVNAETSTVDILDVRHPDAPARTSTIDTSEFGSPNSVAVSGNTVAVAIQRTDKTQAGVVAFYRTSGALIASVGVGALPDMLTFTPDGKHLLVANEGEPTGYGEGEVDPEGSVSVISIPRDIRKIGDADVRTASFVQFNGREQSLRAQGIRIYGPGASAAQDFEPEYIAVSKDSRTAWVTLQENNAIAQIDVRTASVQHVRPLGFKDWSEPPLAIASYTWKHLPSIGATHGGQNMRLGGFSGLTFAGVTGDGWLKFITHTDRGPNGEPTGISRPFVLPDFTPRIVHFTLDPATGTFDLTRQIKLRRADGTPLTGLPNTAISDSANQAHNDEVGVDLFGNATGRDPHGADLEGIALGADGSYWMVDEYRPAIYHFNAGGLLLERFVPIGTHAAAGATVPAAGVAGVFGIETLPEVLGRRRQNRGFEAVVLQDGKVYAFVQSPLRNPQTLGNNALNAMQNVRVVEFDPATRATRQFIYIIDNPAPVGADDTRADKIGDATAVPGGGFLVLERDDDALPEDPLDTITKRVYAFSIGNASDVSAIGLVDVGAGVLKTVDQMSAAEMAAANISPLAKTLHVDLAQAGYASVEKVEGLALLPNGQLALINDNDFQVAQIVIDNATGRFRLAPGYQPEDVVLGLVDVPGLDASDRDNRVNMRDWPVFGMYEPDAIAAFKDRGQTFLVTANEGDARDWPGLSEEARVGSLTLDPTMFPTAATLRNNANLGRLNVTTTLGDVDGDNDFDALFTLGGRSFTIWSSEGEVVFDSGGDFERVIAARYPAFFNASNDDRTFDSRSDNKGPEPEGLAIGEVEGRRYAFVGLERIGGVIVYDISNPRRPLFVEYANHRDFSVTDPLAPEAGDLGPEGLIFIDAKQSPTGCPLLVVANEVSGTVTFYQIEPRD